MDNDRKTELRLQEVIIMIGWAELIWLEVMILIG